MVLRREFLTFSALSLAMPLPSMAKNWPNRSVKVIDPFTPGGSSDVLARSITPYLGKALGQSFYIEHIPGAGGTIGADRVSKADKDGYSYLIGHVGTLAVAPHIYSKLPYNPLTDLEPVAWIGDVANILAINPSLPVNNFQEFIEYAKNNPGKIDYGSGGNGSAAHLAMEYLKLETGIALNHIPYKGTAPAVNDLLGGQIHAVFTGAPALLPFIKAGRLKALAVSSPSRIPSAPQIPTVAESGVKGFAADQWYGLVAPKGVSEEVLEKLNAAANEGLRSSEVQERLLAAGATPRPSSREQFKEHILREWGVWKKVIEKSNIKI